MKKLFIYFSLILTFHNHTHADIFDKEEIINGFILASGVQGKGYKSADGELSKKICRVAFNFAQQLASEKLAGIEISHRNEQLNSLLQPGTQIAEILATTTAANVEEAVEKVIEGWKNSPGHFAAMSPYQSQYCYVLVEGDKLGEHFAGRQYTAVGIFRTYS
jgi:hypothetical protein